MVSNYREFFANPKRQAIAILFLLILFLTLCFASLFFPLRESLTYDEQYHYRSGEAILRGEASILGNQDRQHRNIMPMSALNPLIGQKITEIFPKVRSLGLAEIFLGKIATIICAIILGIYVWIWSRKLYGISAGFLSLILYTLDPNILAHSRVVTQDLFGTFTLFISVYYFWSFLRFGGRKNAFLSMGTFGIAQISRFTSVYLLPIFIFLSVGYYLSAFLKAYKEKEFLKIRQGIRRSLLSMICLLVTTTLIVNIGFSFERTFVKFGEHQFLSKIFVKLQSKPVIGQLPIPLPAAYLQGLDFAKFKQETGFGSSRPYLLGRLGISSQPGQRIRIQGMKEYFPIAFLYKVPIATQLLIFLSTVGLFVNRKKIDFWKNESFLWIPCLFYLVVMSLNNAQLGIRYVLMIFPFLFVLAGRSVRGWNARTLRYRIFIIILVIYLFFSNLSYFPHYISYFNELVIDRKFSYKILADSNLDWGQNQNYLQQYLSSHPNALFLQYLGINGMKLMIGDREVEPERVSIGKSTDLLVVEANQLVGITTYPDRFDWLRSSREPVDHIAYSYLVFKIDERDAGKILTIQPFW